MALLMGFVEWLRSTEVQALITFPASALDLASCPGGFNSQNTFGVKLRARKHRLSEAHLAREEDIDCIMLNKGSSDSAVD